MDAQSRIYFVILIFKEKLFNILYFNQIDYKDHLAKVITINIYTFISKINSLLFAKMIVP